ncbi:MAG: Maf family protein [Gemmatimonadota bacterium]|nr:Maf family protein [Gemmatimonadota bacterium]
MKKSSQNKPVHFILASASPRRAELLRLVGIEHEVVPSAVDEKTGVPPEPGPHVTTLAQRKALAVYCQYPDAVVLGADTIVYHDGEILGKPAGFEDACRMVGRLAGSEHEVYTGIALAGGPDDRPVESAFEVTRVRFRPLDTGHIEAYVRTGEPMDKAGAYGIQGYGATLVESVAGCYFNVMGLPLNRLIRLLETRGLDYRFQALRPIAPMPGIENPTNNNKR